MSGIIESGNYQFIRNARDIRNETIKAINDKLDHLRNKYSRRRKDSKGTNILYEIEDLYDCLENFNMTVDYSQEI